MPFDSLEWEKVQIDEAKLVPASDPLIDKFQRAKKLLRTTGWTQGAAHDMRGFCLLGALYNSGLRWSDPEHYTAIDYLGFRSDGHLTNWNDSAWRFKFQVIRRLNKAIARRQKHLAKTK